MKVAAPDIPAELLNFCKALPKVELHAHLNGSLRDATVRELATTQGIDPKFLDKSLAHSWTSHSRSLTDCFALFDLIHKVHGLPVYFVSVDLLNTFDSVALLML
eukprot:scaffold590822_cov51-Prasinocladus_malaysianus.AAC.1